MTYLINISLELLNCPHTENFFDTPIIFKSNIVKYFCRQNIILWFPSYDYRGFQRVFEIFESSGWREREREREREEKEREREREREQLK